MNDIANTYRRNGKQAPYLLLKDSLANVLTSLSCIDMPEQIAASNSYLYTKKLYREIITILNAIYYYKQTNILPRKDKWVSLSNAHLEIVKDFTNRLHLPNDFYDAFLWDVMQIDAKSDMDSYDILEESMI